MPVLDAIALDSDPHGVVLLRSVLADGRRDRRPRANAFVPACELRPASTALPPAALADRRPERMIPFAALAPAT